MQDFCTSFLQSFRSSAQKQDLHTDFLFVRAPENCGEECPVCLSQHAALQAWPGGCNHSLCASCLGQILRLGGDRQARCPVCRRSVDGSPASIPGSGHDQQAQSVFCVFVLAFQEMVAAPSRALFDRINCMLLLRPRLRGEGRTNEWCKVALAVAEAVMEEAAVQRRDAPEWLQTVLSHLEDLPEWHGEALLCKGFCQGVSPKVTAEAYDAFRRPDLAALIMLQIRFVEQLKGSRYQPSWQADFDKSTEQALVMLQPFICFRSSESLLHRHTYRSLDLLLSGPTGS